MPESPEVQALVEFVGERATGHVVSGVDLVEFAAVKTRARPLASLAEASVRSARRWGKHVDIEFDRAHLIVSLGRHGWVRWGHAPGVPAPSDAPPALASLTFDDGGVLEFTDAGTWVSLGLHIVDDPLDVASIAKLGPDPVDPGFTRAEFDAVVTGRRKRIKAILQEQESLAGIGNAYSDEILHSAKVSPIAHASTLDVGAIDRLFSATTSTLRVAMTERRGIPIDAVKTAKVAAMRVHGRAGEACPACGDEVRSFTFASTTAEYCPTCQTGGVIL